MLTLITNLLSFLMGGLPKLLEFFQDRADKKHELELARMQTERELEMRKAGFEAQARVEEIKTEQLQIQADSASQQFALQERQALYAHDMSLNEGTSQWVKNSRALVRPIITYGMFMLLVFVDVFGFYYAVHTGVAFDVALDKIWDNDTQLIWGSIVSFWFGSQAFSKK
jgi:hypothetical protein